VCDITVSAPIDDKTGFVVDLGVLDRILKEQVKDRFDHRNINLDVAEFADGKLVPTGENLARYIFERVDKELPKPAKVMRVTVGEDDSHSATFSRE
jgi:6-pyruvoyltetrahydropterin/6-carboxytetrahydropterin synthase